MFSKFLLLWQLTVSPAEFVLQFSHAPTVAHMIRIMGWFLIIYYIRWNFIIYIQIHIFGLLFVAYSATQTWVPIINCVTLSLNERFTFFHSHKYKFNLDFIYLNFYVFLQDCPRPSRRYNFTKFHCAYLLSDVNATIFNHQKLAENTSKFTVFHLYNVDNALHKMFYDN